MADRNHQPFLERIVAYPTLYRTLLSAAGLAVSPSKRFAESIGYALNAHIDLVEFHKAGALTNAKHCSDSELGDHFLENSASDLNPFVQTMLIADSKEGALKVHASLSRWVSLEINTQLRVDSSGKLVVQSRTYRGAQADQPICRDVHLLAMGDLLGRLPDRRADDLSDLQRIRGAPRLKTTLLHGALAENLGVAKTAAGEAAQVFDADPRVQIEDLAKTLGVHRRSLQRELKAAGLTAESIKRASMLGRATALLPSDLGLTEIAQAAGYSDHAHMTRAFVSSCGLPPSALRDAFHTH